jgi:long-chain acyl-CoA synthetase
LESLQIQIAAQGEILVKGPSIMKGYFKDPQATRDALRDGWLQTGDRGRLDEAGFLFVEGRIKEAMVTGSGETIYPEDIEPWYEDPVFAEVCVAALPGPDGNDLPTLFAVPADEAVTGEQLEDVFKGLKASAPDRLKAHQCIRLDRPLPRTATGKVLRRLVAAAYQERKTT